MGSGKEERDAKETARLEAFSDGVFAIAITLLVLEIALIAEYVGHAQGRTAAGVYAGTYVAIAIAFKLLWRYAAGDGRLLGRGVDRETARRITRQ